MFGGDGDHGRHVRLGRTILESGQIPTTDLFSHTKFGEPFVPFEWLSEVTFAVADDWLGVAGMALLTALLFGATCWLTFQASRLLGVTRFGSLLAGLAVLALLAAHLLPRPHMFSTFLVALVLLILLRWRLDGARRIIWLLPPLFLVWANTHGGFIAGLIVGGVFWADSVGRAVFRGEDSGWKQITIVAVVSLLATAVNPAGFEVITHSLGYVQSRFMVDNTHEYLSVDFHDPSGRLLLVFLAFVVALLMSGRAGVRFIGGTLFVGWLAAGLYSRRNIDFFAVSSVPFIALWAQTVCRDLAEREDDVPLLSGVCRRLGELGARFSDGDRRFGGILPSAILAALVLWLHLGSASDRSRYVFPPDVFPVDAVAWLSGTAIPESGPVYNHFIWGGYLLYEAWPRVPVFIDGQTDFYGEQLAREYLEVQFVHPGWDAILDKYGVKWALVPTGGTLADRLRAEADWEEVWSDSVAAILVRKP